MGRCLLIALVVSVFCCDLAQAARGKGVYPWLKRAASPKSRLSRRIRPPQGFRRVAVKRRSFAAWLRGLPLLPKGALVHLYNGQRKAEQQHHTAVVDLDVGRRDLQQCADAVMRLWGEYHWSRRRQSQLSFRFLSGHWYPWKRWARGHRRRFRRGRFGGWYKRRKANTSYRNFQRYLRYAMSWTNTSALVRQWKRIPIRSARAGDVLLVGWRRGSPGHAVLILDQVQNKRGQKLFLLGQSYMPAQQFHILKAPGQATSPWFRFPTRGKIVTPEWTFTTKQVYRLRNRR